MMDDLPALFAPNNTPCSEKVTFLDYMPRNPFSSNRAGLHTKVAPTHINFQDFIPIMIDE